MKYKKNSKKPSEDELKSFFFISKLTVYKNKKNIIPQYNKTKSKKKNLKMKNFELSCHTFDFNTLPCCFINNIIMT